MFLVHPETAACRQETRPVAIFALGGRSKSTGPIAACLSNAYPRGIAALSDGRRSPWESASAGYVALHCIRRVGDGRYWALGGFARIYLGLASAVLLHAAYNVPAVAGMFTILMLQGT